jgi:hypothetical protein
MLSGSRHVVLLFTLVSTSLGAPRKKPSPASLVNSLHATWCTCKLPLSSPTQSSWRVAATKTPLAFMCTPLRCLHRQLAKERDRRRSPTSIRLDGEGDKLAAMKLQPVVGGFACLRHTAPIGSGAYAGVWVTATPTTAKVESSARRMSLRPPRHGSLFLLGLIVISDWRPYRWGSGVGLHSGGTSSTMDGTLQYP